MRGVETILVLLLLLLLLRLRSKEHMSVEVWRVRPLYCGFIISIKGVKVPLTMSLSPVLKPVIIFIVTVEILPQNVLQAFGHGPSASRSTSISASGTAHHKHASETRTFLRVSIFNIITSPKSCQVILRAV